MTKLAKSRLLYFVLNLLPVFPVACLTVAYIDNSIINNLVYYGFFVCLFAYKVTGHCPFKVIAKYYVYTDGLNFWKYWAKSYGRRNGLAILVYGSYAFFLFVLTILLI